MEEINFKQKEFWSGSGGDVWVNKQNEIIMLNPLGTKAISKLDLSKATKIIIGCEWSNYSRNCKAIRRRRSLG